MISPAMLQQLQQLMAKNRQGDGSQIPAAPNPAQPLPYNAPQDGQPTSLSGYFGKMGDTQNADGTVAPSMLTNFHNYLQNNPSLGAQALDYLKSSFLG